MNDTRPIGVFDSGVGGLTVLKALIKELPNESFVYIGDTQFVPYGTKSPELIQALASDVANVLLAKNVKALVVACNTISSVALPQIQALADKIPVFDVITPTVAKAVALSHTKTIAVIATETTIASGIYQKKIRELTKNQKNVRSKAAPLLVPLIEEKPHNHPLIQEAIALYLHDIKNDKGIDTLILGCTHYPLIKNHIKEFLGPSITLVDSAEPTAELIKTTFATAQFAHEKNAPVRIFFTSDDPQQAMRIAQDFLGGELKLQQISIPRTHLQ